VYPGQTVNVGWPAAGAAASVQAGASYELSYEAEVMGPLSLSLTTKVGQPVTPFTPYFQEEQVTNPEFTSYEHTFTMSVTDVVGVVFIVSALGADGASGQACFDNVVLAEAP